MKKNDVFWWMAAPLRTLGQAHVLPAADVVIVGAGYTGLCAAIRLARAGRSVQVFDKQRPGEGASTRNGGITSGNLRPSHAELGQALRRAATRRLSWPKARRRATTFTGSSPKKTSTATSPLSDASPAPSPASRLRAARARGRAAAPNARHRSLSRCPAPSSASASAPTSITAAPCAWISAASHPAKLHAGHAACCDSRPAQSVHGEPRSPAVAARRRRFRGHHRARHGPARDVIDRHQRLYRRSDRWLRRRLVPVRSRIIATAPLVAEPDGRADAAAHDVQRDAAAALLLSARARTAPGSCSAAATAPSPATRPGPPKACAGRMVDIFPVLDDVAIDAELVRPCRDEPRHDPAHLLQWRHALCGGILRLRHGLGALGRAQGGAADPGRCRAADRRWISAPPAAVPLFNGKPWFMPAVFGWLNMQDKLAKRRRSTLSSSRTGR